MTDIVYTPTSAYSKDLDTAITKTNLISGLMLFGKVINKNYQHLSLGPGDVVLYTVPAGKTLFLLNHEFIVTTLVATNKLNITTNTDLTFAHVYTTTVGTLFIIPKSFSIPIRLVEGTIITLSSSSYSSGTNRAAVSFTFSAIEIETALLPSFN